MTIVNELTWLTPAPPPPPLRHFAITVDEDLLVELVAWSYANEKGNDRPGSDPDYRPGSSLLAACPRDIQQRALVLRRHQVRDDNDAKARKRAEASESWQRRTWPASDGIDARRSTDQATL